MSTDAPLTVTVVVPPGVKASVKERTITVTGPQGEVKRTFPSGALKLKMSEGNATLTLTLPERRGTRALLLTWERHLGNLFTGVTKGFIAKSKIVAAHFPMKVYEKEGYVVVENFLGEKYPRRAIIVGDTKVEVKGEELYFTGPDIEAVGQSAANMEKTTHIRNYDPRVFQDGIYMTLKPEPRED